MRKFTLFMLITASFAALSLLSPAHAVQQLIKSTATTETIPIMVTDSTGAPVTGVAGLSFTVTVRRPGGSGYVAGLGTVTEDGNGIYDYAPTSTETTLAGSKNVLIVHLVVTATATSFGDASAQIVAFDPADSAALGLTRLDAAITSRSTYAGGPVASVTGSVGSVIGSVGSVAAGVTVTTNNDKTGYSGTATNLPADYQQRGVAVTLPTTPPSGYSTLTLSQIQALLPPRFVIMQIDVSGRVKPILPAQVH